MKFVVINFFFFEINNSLFVGIISLNKVYLVEYFYIDIFNR